MGLPISTAIPGSWRGCASTLLSHVVAVPTAARAVATMIGLGVGIDYALFIVSRHRAQLQQGMEYPNRLRAHRDRGRCGALAGRT